MDRTQQREYPPGLPSAYPTFPEPPSEGSSADPASVAPYSHSSATPVTSSDYALNSASSGSFTDYIRSGSMAQQQSPSMPLSDGQSNGHSPAQQLKSDDNLPIDPSIAAQSPTTYTPHGQPPYPSNPYAPPQQMYEQQSPHTPMYPPHRPEWSGHPQPYGVYPSASGPGASAMVSPVQRPPTGNHPLSTVYSFVPIPGAQQHKRPRRRYEEIERMYKCGWNGCEKAYGTLNHLNAHVTMQSHGAKRTPEEFKEIRKEWKAKKKEEEAARKADEERACAAEGNHAPREDYGRVQQAPNHPPLPPIGYQPAASSNSAAPQYGTQSPGLPDGMAHYPQSPYGQAPPPQMYQQQGH